MSSLIKRLKKSIKRVLFRGSGDYWETRYAKGGNSGDGSYGPLAEFKARVLNDFVKEHGIASVIEFGCGDGNQLTMAEYPKYLGIDVSETALAMCRKQFEGDESKRFQNSNDYKGEQADLSMSLDVIYHLVEDEVYEAYMKELFAAATRFVVIYAFDETPEGVFRDAHVRPRKFRDWVEQNEPDWEFLREVENEHPFKGDTATGSLANFYFYRRKG